MSAGRAPERPEGLSDVHTHGPRHTAGVLRQDDPIHRHQPLYFPNTQPLLPYQWPLSAPYVPYTGFPAFGYGMMMPPSLVLPSCLDISGYMLPHAQMQMLDYRRVMNPHVPPNISHQANRFRFQSTVSHNRVMVSSEVQTDPQCHSLAQDSHVGSESGRGTGCDSPVSASVSFSENKSVACPEDRPMFTHNRVVASNTINMTDVSTLVLQTEQVRIKRSQTPSRLKTIHTNKNNDQTCRDTGDLLQHSLGSIHSEDVVLCSYQSLSVRKDKQGVEAGQLRYSRKHCLPVRKVRTSPSGAALKSDLKLNSSNVKKSFEADKSSKMLMKIKQNSNFKILRLPFDTQTYSLLEASVWSLESLLPYIPSVLRSPKTPKSQAVPLVKNQSIKSTKRQHQKFRKCRSPHGPLAGFDPQMCRQLEASRWSAEPLIPCVPSDDWMSNLTPQKGPESNSKCQDNELVTRASPYGPSTNYSQLEASVWSVESLMPYVPSVVKSHKTSDSYTVPVQKNQHVQSSNHQEVHQCASPYRPSSSWLADLGNVYYYSKLPALQQKLCSSGESPESNAATEGKQIRNPELSPFDHNTKMRKQRSSVRTQKSSLFTDAVSSERVSHFCSRKDDRKDSHYCRKHDMDHSEYRVIRYHQIKQREPSDLCEDCRCHHAKCDNEDESNEEDCLSWREAQRGTTQGRKKMLKNTSGHCGHLIKRLKAH